MSEKFYGKYRAIVTNNNDPEQWGRIKVKCPSVLGDYESAWCMPCVPFLCNDEGFFKVPNIQDGVGLSLKVEIYLNLFMWAVGLTLKDNLTINTKKL